MTREDIVRIVTAACFAFNKEDVDPEHLKHYYVIESNRIEIYDLEGDLFIRDFNDGTEESLLKVLTIKAMKKAFEYGKIDQQSDTMKAFRGFLDTIDLDMNKILKTD